ncbi:HD domain-containing protein [Butyrivibrio hungatei DSM 14810]|uniref:HD domain-containing protein n=2 Tax=Butyrivibrio hungatei TaxID=185008 RepID=A0A1M7SYK4_9FIRM|nr:HD domain-containing protein [Butyrivibrio hungatei DSM 14810]
MKISMRKSKYNIFCRILLINIGIITNVLLSFITNKFKMPIFLDSTGTMIVASIGGIFPGILCGVVSNVLSSIFYRPNIYFGFINALIAIFTAWFFREEKYKRAKNILLFIISIGVINGVFSALVKWFFLKTPESTPILDSIESITDFIGVSDLTSYSLVEIFINIFDKAISITVALFIFYVVPEKIRLGIRNSAWRQKPLTVEETKELGIVSKDSKHSLSVRLTCMLFICAISLTGIMCWVGIGLYYDNSKEEKAESALNAASYAASYIDPYKIDDYIEKSEFSLEYTQTKLFINTIKTNAIGVDYLYIVKMTKDGYYYVFDADKKDGTSHKAGEFVPFDKELLPYVNGFLDGTEIGTIETDGLSGWVLTSYYPITDNNGICRGYACAGVSLEYMTQYMTKFIMRVVLIMSSFFILIFAFGLWMAGTLMVYPINSIEKSIEEFIEAGDDQKKLDAAVKKMRTINIQTEDELEKMYHIICDMALNQTEIIRNVRRISDSTMKMQDGLIVTMADMVESRDSDTGAHVQKTSEYVRIISEGLYRKGYYPEKINPKFISNCVRSAPLHDIGKINISDKILNKPGKLTDEEFAIMKTHTTAGREIIEKTINTVKGESYLKEARNMAAYHHERWDGKGYPEGLHGEVIPLSARIMAVADVFDALTSPRVYKQAFSLDKALSIIKEESGKQFDPKCVEVLLDSLDEVKVVLGKYNHSV